MTREWETPTREPWNPLIRQLLRGVDQHNRLFFASGDQWHLEKAEQLRRYIWELKDWITRQELPGPDPGPTGDTANQALR